MQVQRLKLTAAVVIGGQIVRAGRLVEVTPSEARDLIRRGKAVRDTSDEPADAVSIAAGDSFAEAPLNPAIALFQQDQADGQADATLSIDAAAADLATTAPVEPAVPAAAEQAAPALTDAPADAPKRRGRPPKAQA